MPGRIRMELPGASGGVAGGAIGRGNLPADNPLPLPELQLDGARPRAD